MKTTYINCKCEIYDTEYTIRDYGSYIVVTAPYIRWCNNSGSLDFIKTRIDAEEPKTLIRTMADNGDIYVEVRTNGGFLTLDDILEGYVAELAA